MVIRAYNKDRVAEIMAGFNLDMTSPWLLVDSSQQYLYVIENNKALAAYPVSTSKYGLGCQQDSFKTPTGAHKIALKIGNHGKLNEIYEGRVATGRIARIVSASKESNQDLILTRILWLQGLEPGVNLGEGIDSFRRYIYIHGTQEEGLLGVTASYGCIRMSNKELIQLYDLVDIETFVYIM